MGKLYVKYYNEIISDLSSNQILAPLGLNQETFIKRQKEMDSDFLKMVATELLNFESPGAQTIITGVDPTGSHIYMAHGSDLNCKDKVGFASIGIGNWHANSHLMLAGGTRSKSLAEVLFLVYSAKKKSEVAPGVGKGTDMFLVGPGLGTYTTIAEPTMTRYASIYEAYGKAQDTTFNEAVEASEEYVTELAERANKVQEQEKKQKDGGADPPPDQGKLRDSSQKVKSED